MLCPLPGIRDKTKASPTKSAKSTLHFKNSYYKVLECNIKLRIRLYLQNTLELTAKILNSPEGDIDSVSGKNVARTSILHNCVNI